MDPEFPLVIRSREGEEDWVLDSPAEIPGTLEWFDSDDPEEAVDVYDAKGRRVRLKVVQCEALLSNRRSADAADRG